MAVIHYEIKYISNISGYDSQIAFLYENKEKSHSCSNMKSKECALYIRNPGLPKHCCTLKVAYLIDLCVCRNIFSIYFPYFNF